MARDYNPRRYARTSTDPGNFIIRENIDLRAENKVLKERIAYWERYRTEILYYIAGNVSAAEASVADADVKERLQRLMISDIEASVADADVKQRLERLMGDAPNG